MLHGHGRALAILWRRASRARRSDMMSGDGESSRFRGYSAGTPYNPVTTYLNPSDKDLKRRCGLHDRPVRGMTSHISKRIRTND